MRQRIGLMNNNKMNYARSYQTMIQQWFDSFLYVTRILINFESFSILPLQSLLFCESAYQSQYHSYHLWG